jgi:mRNA-degrading endonuclease YafQ of YafQ-DinJ toxin-antitoxin module
MPKIETTETFLKQFKELPKEIQKKGRKAIRLLAENPKHPSLRSKPIRGAKGIFEASLDMQYRLTYERLPGDVLRLRVVGLHDEALKKP